MQQTTQLGPKDSAKFYLKCMQRDFIHLYGQSGLFTRQLMSKEPGYKHHGANGVVSPGGEAPHMSSQNIYIYYVQ